jgi:hypothetical protein
MGKFKSRGELFCEFCSYYSFNCESCVPKLASIITLQVTGPFLTASQKKKKFTTVLQSIQKSD